MAVTVRFDDRPRDLLLQRLLEDSELSANETLKRLAYIGYLASRHTNSKYARTLIRRDELGAVLPVEAVPDERLAEALEERRSGRRSPSRRSSAGAGRSRKKPAGDRNVRRAAAEAVDRVGRQPGKPSSAPPPDPGPEAPPGGDWVEDLVQTGVDEPEFLMEEEASGMRDTGDVARRLAGMFPQFEDE